MAVSSGPCIRSVAQVALANPAHDFFRCARPSEALKGRPHDIYPEAINAAGTFSWRELDCSAPHVVVVDVSTEPRNVKVIDDERVILESAELQLYLSAINSHQIHQADAELHRENRKQFNVADGNEAIDVGIVCIYEAVWVRPRISHLLYQGKCSGLIKSKHRVGTYGTPPTDRCLKAFEVEAHRWE